jgi:hypothetical protein
MKTCKVLIALSLAVMLLSIAVPTYGDQSVSNQTETSPPLPFDDTTPPPLADSSQPVTVTLKLNHAGKSDATLKSILPIGKHLAPCICGYDCRCDACECPHAKMANREDLQVQCVGGQCGVPQRRGVWTSQRVNNYQQPSPPRYVVPLRAEGPPQRSGPLRQLLRRPIRRGGVACRGGC